MRESRNPAVQNYPCTLVHLNATHHINSQPVHTGVAVSGGDYSAGVSFARQTLWKHLCMEHLNPSMWRFSHTICPDIILDSALTHFHT